MLFIAVNAQTSVEDEIAHSFLNTQIARFKNRGKISMKRKQSVLFRNPDRITSFKRFAAEEKIDSVLFTNLKVDSTIGNWGQSINVIMPLVDSFPFIPSKYITVTFTKKRKRIKKVTYPKPYVHFHLSKPILLTDPDYAMIYFAWSSGETFGGDCYYIMKKNGKCWLIKTEVNCKNA